MWPGFFCRGQFVGAERLTGRGLKEQLLQFRDFAGELGGNVLSLFLWRRVVVKFGATILVQGEAVAVGAERLGFAVVGESGVAWGVGLFHLGEQRSAVGEVGLV